MKQRKLASTFKNMKPNPMLLMFELAGQYNDTINLGVGEPDFDTPYRIVEAAYQASKEGLTHYTPVEGFLNLREAIACYWKDSHNVPASPDNVMVTTGGIQGLYFALQTLLDPGDEVIMTDPCFPPYLQQVQYLYGKVVSVPVFEKDGFALKPERLKEYITDKSKVLLINSPANPTGALMSCNDLESIAEIVEENDLWVISDEVYDSFCFSGKHASFAAIPDINKRTFTVGGFSKPFAMTGWRVGYVICPSKSEIIIMKALAVASTMCVNSMAQRAALFAMQNCWEEALSMIEKFRKRMEHTHKLINGTPNLSCLKADGSFYLFPNIKKTGMKSVEFSLKLAEEAHVITIPGLSFGKNGDNFIRIACTVPEERISEAFKRISSILTN
jgi:aminotransferase